MAKKIDKSKSHAQALIRCMEKVRDAYLAMNMAIQNDSSANPNERQADADWVARQIKVCDRALLWWEGDITRIEAKAKAQVEASTAAPASQPVAVKA